jgi:DNA-binding transcriptional LysR family regulator
MNIDQLKGVIAVDEEGSVSQAAKRLFISQSTLSNSIASLEREVGFQIFERYNHGMKVTAQGRKLISYARSILSFSQDILSISRDDKKRCRFRLISDREVQLNRIFVNFCMAHKEDMDIDISFASASVDHTIEMIYRNLADFGIICIDDSKRKHYEEYCKKSNILMKPLRDMPLEVIFAADHPLNFEDDFLRALPAYPRITIPGYAVHLFPEETPRKSDDSWKDGCRRISVADRQTRFMLLSRGVGYMHGLLDADEAEKWGLVSRKLDMQFSVYTLVSEDKKNEPCILEFEELLRKERMSLADAKDACDSLCL